MKKWIKRIILGVLLMVFLVSTGGILFIMQQYRANEQIYDEASQQFTDIAEEQDAAMEIAPVVVDFEALRQVSEDVAGWIYCEDTVINYPVMQGEDNDLYLHHAYDGTYSVSGSIFADAENRKGFVDSNTIIYGHHMKDNSMFATLSDWAAQEYYEAHPVMWLLTPEQDYKIVLFSGYTTSALSDTYLMFQEPCEEFNTYLANAAAQSDFRADVDLNGEDRYVLLSTCAYVFDNARYVLHGKLVPADSAGGLPIRK